MIDLQPRFSGTDPTDFKFLISEEPCDPVWDGFLAATAGGHHVQTSMWGRVKGSLGWQTIRVTAHRDNRIVGGGQILLRPLTIFGTVGYLPKGPILETFDEQLAINLLATLHQAARKKRVRYLLVQPADDDKVMSQFLTRHGFYPSQMKAIPVGTAVVDLTPEPEELLARAKSKTRYNIRLAARKGVTVREGRADELPLFHRLLMATANRQGFGDYGLHYFEAMQKIMEPEGHFKLFFAEHEGKPLSALLIILFGETALFKKGGWSGENGRLHPNERMHWEAILWAREQGYRYYDFEGIDEEAAWLLVNGQELPSNLMTSTTRFKVGFGGMVRVNPGTYDYVYNPVLRWLYRSVFPRTSAITRLNRLVGRLIGR